MFSFEVVFIIRMSCSLNFVKKSKKNPSNKKHLKVVDIKQIFFIK